MNCRIILCLRSATHREYAISRHASTQIGPFIVQDLNGERVHVYKRKLYTGTPEDIAEFNQAMRELQADSRRWLPNMVTVLAEKVVESFSSPQSEPPQTPAAEASGKKPEARALDPELTRSRDEPRLFEGRQFIIRSSVLLTADQEKDLLLFSQERLAEINARFPSFPLPDSKTKYQVDLDLAHKPKAANPQSAIRNPKLPAVPQRRAGGTLAPANTKLSNPPDACGVDALTGGSGFGRSAAPSAKRPSAPKKKAPAKKQGSPKRSHHKKVSTPPASENPQSAIRNPQSPPPPP